MVIIALNLPGCAELHYSACVIFAARSGEFRAARPSLDLDSNRPNSHSVRSPWDSRSGLADVHGNHSRKKLRDCRMSASSFLRGLRSRSIFLLEVDFPRSPFFAAWSLPWGVRGPEDLVHGLCRKAESRSFMRPSSVRPLRSVRLRRPASTRRGLGAFGCS